MVTRIVLGVIITCVLGCSPSVVVERPTPMGAPGTELGLIGPSLSEEYIIQPGDELDVKFFFNPDLNESIKVRPDGRISMQLVGEILAAGLSPIKLRKILTDEYEKELKNPEIAVIVKEFGSRVYVDGEVETPGEIKLTGPLTVLQAIAKAEGLTEKAWKEAVVIRRIKGEPPLVIEVDLNAVLTGQDFSQDLGLVPFDVVYVPRSPIANVNLWVDQYIRKNIPINMGLFFPAF